MKKNYMLFSILFLIYAGGGVISLIAFGMNGSYLSRKQTVPAAAAVESVESDISTASTVEPVNEPAEESVENSDNTLIPSTPEPEEASEPVTEATDTSETEEAAEPEKTYYAFTVIDGVTDVCIRETAVRNATILSHIDGGKSGYVLEKGDTRTKILTKKGTVGYIYNEYLTISEIPMDEFPEEYR